jgi:hypothetical protein
VIGGKWPPERESMLAEENNSRRACAASRNLVHSALFTGDTAHIDPLLEVVTPLRES